MNTSTPLDPRSLAHRLTTVGHTLHHRLFAQLRESELHPKTVLILRAIDGRIDAPWIADRIARGGKRLDALAGRGWIARGDDGWALTDEGREILDRVDADRSALLADIPADELERLVAALDTLEAALGIDEDAPTGGFGPGGRGFGRGFGRGKRGGFGPGRRPGAGDGDRERDHDGEHGHGFGPRHGDGDHGHGFGPRHGDGDHGRGHGRGFGPRHGGHGFDRGHRGADRAAQRAYERGFDAGFSRGRDSSASA